MGSGQLSIHFFFVICRSNNNNNNNNDNGNDNGNDSDNDSVCVRQNAVLIA